MHNDTEAVLQVIETMTRAFEAGDFDAVMASYEPEAAIVFEPGQPQRDREAQLAWFRQAHTMSPRFTYSGHDVVIQGDIATHFAPWTMRATTPDGQQLEQQGLSVAVLRRQPDGSWRMVMDVPNGDHLLR